MKNNHKFLIVMFTLVIVTLTACGDSPEEPNAESNDKSPDSKATQSINDTGSEKEDTQDLSHVDQETGADSSEETSPKQEEEKQDNPPDEQSQEEPLEEYKPSENDVVFNNNELKNRDILENFMEVAGENGENNESEIKVVRDEGASGVLIYDLKSRYDENADQGWIDVSPDLSYYRPSENEVHNIFNNAAQQCGNMEKDEVQGYYKLYECRTHWEFHLISNC